MSINWKPFPTIKLYHDYEEIKIYFPLNLGSLDSKRKVP